MVRKQGLRRALRNKAIDSRLPLWRSERNRRINVGDEVLAIIAEARAFKPVVHTSPGEMPADPLVLTEWVDEVALKAELLDALPVDNLMHWLRQAYGHLPDAVLLRLYHDLVRDPGWQASQEMPPTQTDLHAVRVHYHPHQRAPG